MFIFVPCKGHRISQVAVSNTMKAYITEAYEAHNSLISSGITTHSVRRAVTNMAILKPAAIKEICKAAN